MRDRKARLGGNGVERGTNFAPVADDAVNAASPKRPSVAVRPRDCTLTRFARDLVKDKGGLWKDLREAEPRQALLNTIVYALVPAHVRSPRRVKIILNNFATNARIVQGRGIDWLPRAAEIAKLTVLQTEFPEVAAALL